MTTTTEASSDDVLMDSNQEEVGPIRDGEGMGTGSTVHR